MVLLIDTYDTEAGAEKVVKLARRLGEQGIAVKAVRLDSGDLAEHAIKVRAILDAGGCGEVGIFSSGGLDEFVLRDLLSRGAPIDGFGIGTRLDTSADAPYLDCAYKLVEYAGVPRRKRSEGKATWPGRKQVFRVYGDDGGMRGDTLAMADEELPGDPLLIPVMRGGRRVRAAEPLADIRRRVAASLDSLPGGVRALTPAGDYPVGISARLQAVTSEFDRRGL